MIKTWHIDQESRPNFREIGEFFERTFEDVAQKDDGLEKSEKLDKMNENRTAASTRYSICSMTDTTREKVLEEVEVYIANPPRGFCTRETMNPQSISRTTSKRNSSLDSQNDYLIEVHTFV